MNYFTEYWYVWIIFAIMCVFLFSFYGKKFKQVKEKRKQYEEKLAQEKDNAKKIDLVNEANKKLADVAIKNYQKLIAKLITAQTADSPLRFRIDPNL